MESLLYISALVAAIAFAVLVIYLVRTLKSANRTLDHVANTMAGLEKQVTGITKETEELLHRTNV
ncbi:general stress protein [Halalkalibacter wakoensis JCM 9140]|uniref:General stress protein n=1 Tax=Halalkalibacter wakoensis JCM 9140 TaxID=1236970 RepID=W4Q1H1_9BACI|nr:general stress protein [Halalkalibacter wakoensis JCM 9140]